MTNENKKLPSLEYDFVNFQNTKHHEVILTDITQTIGDFASTPSNIFGRIPLLSFCLEGIHK